MAKLFTPITIRSLVVKNRVFVSPMCMYSCELEDGIPTPWHMVHLGSRAVGGAGLVMAEATAVTPAGRISPKDTGLWSDAHAAAWAPITAFIAAQGSVPAIQLAHAGRKASFAPPSQGGKQLGEAAGGWETMAPSAVPFNNSDRPPHAVTAAELDVLKGEFVAAAKRAVACGFQVIELHFAHGYFAHEMLSPLSNARTDEFGGSLDNRMRWPLSVAAAVRASIPVEMPLFVRISATDWAPEGQKGWDSDQAVEFVKRLRDAGCCDLIDVSSGGNLAAQQLPPLIPGYQVPLASRMRRETGVLTSAVGLITDAKQAEDILNDGHADVVFLARELLRDPYWPLHAAAALGADATWPAQYLRAKPAAKVQK